MSSLISKYSVKDNYFPNINRAKEGKSDTMSDIEIARSVKLKRIEEIANNIGINAEEIEAYGKYKAKINETVYETVKNNPDGKLILVTAISPTPLGEGKTTMSIATCDGLAKIGKKAILALREPSLGPVFGIKGGATGGGHAQIAPMEDINLHFTGDIHAITAANNLLAALIDNHIYNGNMLGIKKVVWKRCLDMNDRQLRKVNTGLSGERGIVERQDGFDISVASEIMAIMCLAKDLKELKSRLGNIIIGYNEKEEPIFAKDIKAEGSMLVLLKEAFKPNLVQTLEHNPCLIHGGPFANIAHGCNSIVATKLALKLGEYVVTEAGFGSDLGAEKFIDIKCREANIKPDAVICVATLKAIKYHGGAQKEDILKEDLDKLAKGMKNLFKHIDNLQNKFGLNVIVAINKFNTDSQKEINFVKSELNKKNIELSLVEAWEKGGEGAIDLAEKIVKIASQNYKEKLNYIYSLEDSIEKKINKICTEIYGAKEVEFSDEAISEIRKIEKMGYDKLPICIAKTQYSFSDDAKNLQCEEEFNIHIREINLKAGAKFIVAISGKIMTMPGLPKIPAAESIDLDENGEIIGIF